METFEEYLETIENLEQRARLQEVLDWVSETFPGLERRVAWKQPMFTDHGTFIIGFSVAKKHIAVSPEKVTLDRFDQKIAEAGFGRTSQLIRIPWESPVPWELLREMIAFNIEDKAECATFWRK